MLFSKVLVLESTSVNEVEKVAHPFKVFPNPSNGFFQIDLGNSPPANVRITIYNHAGQIIFDKKYMHGGGKVSMENKFETGLYFVKIKTEQQAVYMKLIVN